MSALCHGPETLKFRQNFCKNLKSHIVNTDDSHMVMIHAGTGNGEGKVVPIHSMKVYGGVKELIERSGQL